jgi:hypothetical protein
MNWNIGYADFTGGNFSIWEPNSRIDQIIQRAFTLLVREITFHLDLKLY